MESIKSVFILGRQPALGLAELESLYGANAIQPIADNVIGSSLPPEKLNFQRLGGSVKLAKVLTILEATDWKAIEKHLLKESPSHAAMLPEGKLRIGLSAYHLPVKVGDLHATGLRLKKTLRVNGRTVRVIPNQEPALSSAQILYNKLTSELGWELVCIGANNRTIIAQTIAEQDIDAYAARDQKRPKRDARVGMLPPKLAQTIINLAVTQSKISTILDPFCGTGVVLQEAALMGYNLYGSDIEPRMIEYSEKNLLWLNETHKLQKIEASLETGDATTYEWKEPFQAVACEGYLGQPFSTFPAEDKLRSVIHTCNQVAKGFLKNIAEQIPSGTRLCIALPAWHRPNGDFLHLPLLDQLDDLGYNRISFVHVRTRDLLYYRPDQVVARELLVITRK